MSLFNKLSLDEQFGKTNPEVRQLAYDSLTPILAYNAVGGPGAVMMESAYDEGYGKYSYIGINPLATFTARGQKITLEYGGAQFVQVADPYALLPLFTSKRKAFGFIAYDGVRVKECLPDRHPPAAVPDFFFRVYHTVICFDHQTQQLMISHEGSSEEVDTLIKQLFTPTQLPELKNSQSVQLIADLSDKEYMAKVVRAQEYIRQGDIFQVVLSRTFSVQHTVPPLNLYRAVRKLNPTPYLFLFEEADFTIVGASPELLV